MSTSCKPDFSLQGKTALITGSTQGLGLVIARAYAASGARIVINGRDGDRVAAIVQALTAEGHDVHPYVQDISRLEEQELAFSQLCRKIGTPDILVNNVGIRIRKALGEATLRDIVELINVDLIAAVQMSRLAAAAMADNRIQGRLITLTSIAGELARMGDAIYPIAKQGLCGLIRALAVEYGPRGITSNGIAPGTFATESNAALAADPVKGPIVVGRNPLGRWARPDEIGGAAVFLASSSASYVNGHILVVDGGFSVTF
ncbi:gluconate 5-dehydrogenase [Pollutimonas nitritireducens]|uniref:Gluconate 5-dehydrogenase n=1 Tax=Pollutimonas nitritireducens TaxID=2045209 RepID=A0A2N4UH30_9BURK|nr:SDR family oxidoreductase [Pollutimonas nitritireducens]PLC54332.1 gluconate 5-dehydrogenase [Pollutimonas nitritireducens]